MVIEIETSNKSRGNHTHVSNGDESVLSCHGISNTAPLDSSSELSGLSVLSSATEAMFGNTSTFSDQMIEGDMLSKDKKSAGAPIDLERIKIYLEMAELPSEEEENSESSDEDSISDKYIPHYAGLEKPNIPEGTSEEKKQEIMNQWAKEVARKRKRDRREIQKERIRNSSHLYPAPIPRKLSELRDLGASAFPYEGECFPSKAHFQCRMMEVAEMHSSVLKFTTNDNFKCVARTKRGVEIFGEATARTNERGFVTWTCLKIFVGSGDGLTPSKGEKRTAYSDEVLSSIIRDQVEANPSLPKKDIREIWKEYIQHIDKIPDHFYHRVRERVNSDIHGKASENIQYLPALQAAMRDCGHHLEFTTITGEEMTRIVVQVAKKRHDMKRNDALAIPEAKRTEKQRLHVKPWNEMRAQYLKENIELLEKLNDPNKQYVDAVFFCFEHALKCRTSLLKVVGAHSCCGKLQLDVYNIFSIMGLSANGDIIPIVYAYIADNQSADSWTRVYRYAKERFPGIEVDTTFMVDGEKSTTKALNDVFGEKSPRFFCLNQRIKSLSIAAAGMYKTLVHATSIDSLNILKNGESYKILSKQSRKMIDAQPDHFQFLSAAVAKGVLTYGRTNSAFVESQNAHIIGARRLDLFSSVLWICDQEQRRFLRLSKQSREFNPTVIPWVTKKLEKADKSLPPLDSARVSQNEDPHEFVVTVGRARSERFTVTLQPEGQSSRFGTCSCGEPSTKFLPCKHMRFVASTLNLDLGQVIPECFSPASWKAQYPESVSFKIPCKEDILENLTMKNPLLKIPVAAPNKTGQRKRTMPEMETFWSKLAKRSKLV